MFSLHTSIMSKKRSAVESSSKEPTTEEDSDLVVFAKRVKLDTLIDTTLQDLPIEMLECILVKAVVMEVKDMKMAKVVWKEKADLVINRLQSVCSQWRNILMTNFFQNQVHRILDGTAQETIHLEILHELRFELFVAEVTTMKNEIFMLFTPNGQWNGQGYVINVYNCNDMALGLKVKDVIPLREIQMPYRMVGCNASNCLYVLNEESDVSSVLRITKDERHQYKISTWITDLQLSIPILSVSANGSLSIASSLSKPNPSVVSIYNANGFLQYKLMLSEDTHRICLIEDVIHKTNGNLVLAVCIANQCETQLVEIDTRGNVLRQFRSRLAPESGVNFADIYGRIWMTNWHREIEVVDAELNQLDFVGSLSRDQWVDFPLRLQFNIDRNEVMYISKSWIDGDRSRILTICRFTGK